MTRYSLLVGLAGVALLLAAPGRAAAEKDIAEPQKAAIKEAVKAATTWLALADQGKFSESWKQAAPYFQKNIKEPQWQQAMVGVREPLGKVIKRETKSTTYTTSAPGAPDGEYVIIQFSTSFEHKAEAVETVTPMKGQDGTWKVSGYYIR